MYELSRFLSAVKCHGRSFCVTLVLILVSVISGTCLADDARLDISPTDLFQNIFFTFSNDASLICGTGDAGHLADSKIQGVLGYYERLRPGIQKQAVRLLTEHTNDYLIEDLLHYKDVCANKKSPEHCVLAKYWGNPEVASRVLALFYDTGIAIKRSNSVPELPFESDQIWAIERAIRTIPIHLRERILYSLPVPWDKTTVNGKAVMQIYPSRHDSLGETDTEAGEVSHDTNLMSLNPRVLDYRKSGSTYANLNLKFLNDFRLDVIVHEIGHIVDFLYSWDGKPPFSYFGKPTAMSLNEPFSSALAQSHAGIWPTNWWSAYSSGGIGFANGRYETNNFEKFAEMFAQYILVPEGLKQSTPIVYNLMKNTIFNGIEYKGYEQCGEIVRPLSQMEKLLAPVIDPYCDSGLLSCHYWSLSK